MLSIEESNKFGQSQEAEEEELFHENGCFSHYTQRVASTKPRKILRNQERFFFKTSLSTIKSLIFYIGAMVWENQNHL